MTMASSTPARAPPGRRTTLLLAAASATIAAIASTAAITAVAVAIISTSASSAAASAAAAGTLVCGVDPGAEEGSCLEPVDLADPLHSLPDDDDDDDDDYDDDYDDECVDRDDACAEYASPSDGGENACLSNPGYMGYHCPASCGSCGGDNDININDDGGGIDEYALALARDCHDGNFKCSEWASTGECDANPNYMLSECRRSCFVCFVDTNQFGVHQEEPAEIDPLRDATVRLIENSTAYMKAVWTSDEEHKRVRHKCRNQHASCSYWAAITGGCDDNPNYMNVNCAPACQTCHLLDTRLRCPIEEGNDSVWKPGDLNELFENIVDDADGSGAYRKYNPKAMSRPEYARDGKHVPNVEKDGPWLIAFENFISDEEAAALIAAGGLVGYERSADVGKELPDGTHESDVNEGRTSHNAWCNDETCGANAVIAPVIERIANVTGTNVHNSEYIQLLQYEPGQFYNQHHDYIEYQAEMPCGPRILTLFLYLNDVEEGGGTRFPLLDLTVQPKKGNAVLWPSVLDESPEEKDGRTDHEAMPVLKGIKYGANAWIHSRDFRTASTINCV